MHQTLLQQETFHGLDPERRVGGEVRQVGVMAEVVGFV